MNLQEAYELRRQEVLSLQRQNKKLQKELEQVEAGLFTPEEKTSLHKQIIKLARTLADTEKERDRYHNLWDRERERNLTCEFARMDAEEENRLLKEENRSLKEQLSAFRKEAEQDAAKKIQALCDEVSRLQAILDNDGTNSGTPTSKTPAGKKKVIPNSRVKSNRKTGGQPGHAKAALYMLAEEEVTEYEDHTMDACPACGSLLRKVSERAKDEIDYEVKVIKRRHRFIEYICTGCGKLVHSPIPSALKEPAQYGKNLQATALSLLNLGFVSISRSARFLAGLLHGTSPCEGFLAKLQERYAKQLQGFVADARQYCLNTPFRIPTSNNLSERSLRMVKCREKVSGQFHSVETARHFADIRTYLETCRRNGINEFDALTRLTQGVPFTIEELLATGV